MPGEDDRDAHLFTPSFFERLRRLNRVRRELRRMQLRITQIDWVGAELSVRIERDPAKSLAPLLDSMERRRFRPVDAGVEVAGQFKGVTVRWIERGGPGVGAGRSARLRPGCASL
ncbi:hypothetical protein Busp01_40460 [Trinickia caryophylli]|nr:hypothetical protein Busp01_40460 [Trinickia caryophylli]